MTVLVQIMSSGQLDADHSLPKATCMDRVGLGCLKPSCFCLFQAAQQPTQRIARIRLLIILPYTDGLLLSSHSVKVVIWNRLDGLSYIDDYIQNPSDDGESEKKVRKKG